jgi:hypothetical protein
MGKEEMIAGQIDGVGLAATRLCELPSITLAAEVITN